MAQKHSGFVGLGNIDLSTNSKDISCENITIDTNITDGGNSLTVANAKSAYDHSTGDGSDHADVASNTAHSAGDGSDHADVASNTTHRTSNGSDHSYIDQDVTSGSSPNFNDLTVNRIRGNTKTITDSSDNEDVEEYTIVRCNTSDGDITLGGLSGGNDGQIIIITKYSPVNDLIIEHNNEADGDEIFLNSTGGDLTLSDLGESATYFYDNGGYWIEAMHTTPATSGTNIKDGDEDTKIQCEEGADEDKIRFDTGGTERAVLDGTSFDINVDIDLYTASKDLFARQIGIGTTSPDPDGRATNCIDIHGTDSGVLSFFSTTRADADNAFIGAFEAFFNNNDANYRTVAQFGFWLDGSTAGKRGGKFRIYTKPDNVTSANIKERLLIEENGDWTINEGQAFIDYSTGNVGIGTTSPTETLHIKATNAAECMVESTDANSYARFRMKNDARTWGFIIDNNDYYNIYDYTASANRFIITTSGDTGIGTTNPDTRLEVNGDVSFPASTTITGSSDSQSVADIFYLACNTSGGSITLGGLSDGKTGQLLWINKASSSNSLIIEHNEATGTQKFLCDGSADITIGSGYGSVLCYFDGNYWRVLGP